MSESAGSRTLLHSSATEQRGGSEPRTGRRVHRAGCHPGQAYGWPNVYGKDGMYRQSTPPGGLTTEQWRERSVPRVIGYNTHAAAMQMKLDSGSSFPAEYSGDAFATMRGSGNRNPASGYEIVRIHFKDAEPQKIEPFLTGLLSNGCKTHFAHPVGLAVAKDGSLLVADDANGVIYRVAYTGNDKKASADTAAPADAMKEQAAKGVGIPLAN